MNYLITGGTGFLGAHICKRLLQSDNHIVCYDIAPNATSIQQVLTGEELAKITLITGDIRDSVSLISTCQTYHIDRIIHLAGLLQGASDDNVRTTIDINVKGTVNVFEAARLCGIRRVVWASSISVIGRIPDTPLNTLLPSDTLHNPVSLYGNCKKLNEFIGSMYNQRYGLETVGLRFTILYGQARMRGASNWIVSLINKPAVGEKGVVEYGDMMPDLLYIKDAARAVTLACEAEHLTRSAYTIRGDSLPMTTARDTICKLLPDADITLLPGNMDLNMLVAPGPEREDLGYEPAYTFEEGARETINSIRESRGLPLI